ncbi:hypothetical protein POTOM_041306 [Populus tomentosa]|uniref:PORR domain-containing protein n=1 Tax=Populus tomentosa TaxID=118781 RepID=A0A8X8CIH2_POPTO|nr:hypothetical protein POTOM_041306 [Populus tomentosa]
MDLQKKPFLILKLKSIIQSQRHQSVFLRDLEKEVGFLQKWNFMSVIEKYPSIFRVGGGNSRSPPFVTFTEKAEKIAREEAEAKELTELILVKNLLLMLSVDCRVPLEKIGSIENELEVASREERRRLEGVPAINPTKQTARISKDGNFLDPFDFDMGFAAANSAYFLLNCHILLFISSSLIAKPPSYLPLVTELLSLTMEKRMTSAQLDAFHSEFMLPSRLLYVFLEDAYDGSNLIEKCPLHLFHDKFVVLSGRAPIDSCSARIFKTRYLNCVLPISTTNAIAFETCEDYALIVSLSHGRVELPEEY